MSIAQAVGIQKMPVAAPLPMTHYAPSNRYDPRGKVTYDNASDSDSDSDKHEEWKPFNPSNRRGSKWKGGDQEAMAAADASDSDDDEMMMSSRTGIKAPSSDPLGFLQQGSPPVGTAGGAPSQPHNPLIFATGQPMGQMGPDMGGPPMGAAPMGGPPMGGPPMGGPPMGGQIPPQRENVPTGTHFSI